MSDRLVIIPTYNEKENITQMVHTVMGLEQGFHLLIVDDSSPDGTGEMVKAMQQQFSGRLHIEERQGKLGLGTAYVHGFKWALERNYTYICEMDCDFSHDPAALPSLFEACENRSDVTVGSRYCKGVNVVNWPMSRVLLSFFASKYVRMITGMRVNDATAGFVCYRAEVLRTVLAEPIRFIGYAFQIEMKFKSWKYGYRITEVPIIFTDRQKGKSKMSTGIIWEAMFGVISLKISSWFKKWERHPEHAPAGHAAEEV